jgi:peptide/nickel transport system substrate-binding protein
MKMSQKKTSSTKAIAAIVIILLVLVGGVAGYYYAYLPSTKPMVPNPDTYVFSTFGDVDKMDPAVLYDTASGEIAELTMETLVYYKLPGSTTEIAPKLASSWDISPDGTVYTFHLDPNAKFNDGTPVTADDVKYSIDRTILIGDPNGPAPTLHMHIKGAADYLLCEDCWENTNDAAVQAYLNAGGVKVIDPQTVQITLDAPYSPFLSTMAYSSASIVNKKLVEANGGLKPGFYNDWMNQHATEVGSGPYKLAEWTPKSRVILERNENYWRTPPFFKRIIVNEVDEVGTRELALFSGDADSIALPATNLFDVIEKDPWLNNKEIVPLKPGITVSLDPTYTVSPNFGMNTKWVDPVTGATPFGSKDFRYAFSYAFDYKTFIDVVVNGAAVQGVGPIPPGMFGYNEQLVKSLQFSYSPDKAKQYFLSAKAAGAYADGQVITLYYNTGNEPRRRGCLMLKDAIEGLGVGLKIEVQELDWPTFLAKQRAMELPIFFIGWAPDFADPDDYVPVFANGETGTFARRQGFDDPAIDQKLAEASIETDLAKRQTLYDEIITWLFQEAYTIWGAVPLNIYVSRDWVKGWFYNPMFAGPDIVPAAYGMSKEERTEQVAIAVGPLPAFIATIATLVVPNYARKSA